jgi:hypothetical protein
VRLRILPPFVSIDGEGNLRIDRGYVRPEDEPAVEPVEADGGDAWTATESNPSIQGAVRSRSAKARRMTLSSRFRNDSSASSRR